MMESKVLIGILLCLFVVQLSASGVTISGSSPSGSNVNGRILVAVTGCGFRQYNQAVCTWDYQYFSPIHVIVSDDLIYCETPQLQKGDFEVLPKTTSLYVYFDGDRDNSVLISSNYVFGPSIQSYTPYDGYVNGGEDFKVVGKGFSEFSFVNVTFDDVQCINTTILNDHEITCVVPPGEFNQNAIVNVMFEDNPNYFLHFTRTFHYGPILYGVNPPCGSVVGGTRVTILGTNLDDPILAVDADPAGYTPEVEVIFNGGLNRTYALDIEFNPSSNLVTFTTPEIGVVFGEEVQFAVFFKTVFSKVDVTSLNNFVYGPIVYNSANYGNYLAPIQNPSISSGSLGGGESITIYGCGLSEWNATQYNVLYQGSTLCESGSINVYELDNSVGDYLTCTVAAQDCNYSGSDAGEVYVQLNTTIDTVGVQVLPPSSESPLSYSVGPVVDASTLNPTRGPRTGGQVVTIQGQNLFYSASNSATTPGWTVTVNFLYPSDASVNIPSVTATFVSNTELTFVSPVGLFDLDVEVSLDFGSTCLEYPRDSSNPTYHFGPVCNQVTPTNGYYSGNSRFTVIGEGFQEDDNLVGDTFVRLCLDRLSTSDTCAYEESPRSSYSMNSTHISLLTPSSRQNVATKVGNNRLFGDVAEVYVHFYQPGGEFIEFPRNQLRPGLEVARIACPNYYTFAPEVTTLSPTYGQVVERSDDPETNELVISGTYFNDPTLENDISVVFEYSLIGVDSTIQNDNTLTTNVTWGLTANSDSVASVIFDNSNMTYSGVNVGFGPAIYNIYASKFGYPVVDEYNPNGDIYGLSPNGGDTIVVEGEGFLDYGSEVKCVIEGDDATVYIDSDTQIRCITPCRPFGAKGSLALMFGSYCGSSEVNWENVIYASQALYYNPRIDYFTPSYGRVSGGDTVTLKGEGFYGWGKYECFFGHYSDQQHVIPTNNGTTVVCKTPINRAEFNTYVTVHVQLAAEDDDDTVDVEVDQISNCFDRGTFDESVYAGVENHDEKVWASSKFYYGPVCTDISPSSCPLGGCSATLVGSGFQDCVTGNQSIYTQTYPYNDCIFRYYRVRFVDPSTGDVTYVDSPTNDTYNSQNSDTGLVFTVPSGACGYEPEIEIEFYTPVISTEPSGTSSQAVIQCSYPNTRSYLFHYGPLFSSQSSTYYDSSRMTSYGWSGDSITISGIDFRDAALYSSTSSVTCNFGDLSTSATSVSDTSVVCTVPAVDTSYWDTLVDVSLTFGAASSCSVDAQQFHFGPTIRSITPTRGYVAGETPVTIDGFAFGCCGITSYSCLFPEVTPAKTDDTVLASENSVTCTVPKNQYVDVLINNIGVAFTSTIFGTENLTFTEDDTALRYYYGPYVNSFSPTHTTLSGRDQYVVISGEGFADPYFLETFCDFFNETNPGFEFVPIEPLEEIYVTDTTITCKVPEFAHYPGAIDKIRPRWRRSVEELRPELFKNYYKTEAPAVVNENTAPYFSDGGSDTPVYLTGLYYGPVITSVCSGLLCNENLPRSSISGGLSINVTFDSLRDFVSSPAFNFGNEQALCIFGRRTANRFSIIHANPDNDNGGYVVCTTPAGDFNFDGEISVLLNPLYSMISDTTNTYHSSPYTTGISTNWVSSNGYEPIVVYGNGFCNYQTVRCIFSNGLTSNDATEGEITTDKMVTCRTPARSAGYSFISLQFCSSSDFDVCDCGSEQDYITVPDRVTFYGITGISPAEGSVCGGTTITFSGYGFYQFDRISCSWPNSASQTASILSDNLFTCVSLDVSPVFGNSEIHCSDISVVGIRDNYYYQLNVPSKFEAGLPQVVSISPSSQKINNFSQFTVSGLYFNANDLNVYCQFDNTTLTNATLTVSNGEYVVLCTPPSSLNVGTYDLELVFECSSNNEFTTNVVHFDVTQTPVIEKVRPISGPEIGGQTITISGYNFEGGSLYVCVFGDLIVGATYDETASQITCKTPAFLDTYEDVKVPLYISLDGGDTLFRSKDDYIYQNIAYVRDDNVCVKEEDFNAANQLSLSFAMTIFVVFISSLLNFF